ncbi:MAG: type II secretion system F family protein [Bowdeniella nasicola]|nr:type II secretion system F family protein [Bowdeniella nasicola]
MGLIIGLLAGGGLTLIYLALVTPANPPRRRHTSRLARILTDAQLSVITPRIFLGVTILAAFVAATMTYALTTGITISCCAAIAASVLPMWYVVNRAKRHRIVIRGMWPDVIDHLLSSIRSGMPLTESLTHLADHGPVATRQGFATFRHALAATGRIDQAFDALKERFADPTADRLVEALRVANDVGGHDVGSLLRTLAGNLRAEQRARGELLARQSWTVNGARLAAAAPWLILAMLSTRPENATAFDTPAGALLLAGGGLATVIAHRAMHYLGALPQERRALR